MPSRDLNESETGFDFVFNSEACKICSGRCCRSETGYVWVKKSEIIRIAEFLELETGALINEYLVKVGKRYSLKELHLNDDYPCVFFDLNANQCLIYPVRPSQCKTYPFWDEYKSDKGSIIDGECPGVMKTHKNTKVNR